MSGSIFEQVVDDLGYAPPITPRLGVALAHTLTVDELDHLAARFKMSRWAVLNAHYAGLLPEWCYTAVHTEPGVNHAQPPA